MTMSEIKRKQIEEAEVNTAEGFITWISNTIPNICDSEQEKEETIKKFVSDKLSSKNPDSNKLAWELIRNKAHVERFKSITKDPDAELLLFKRATASRKYPDDYPELIQSLIYLYQHKSSQPVVINVIFDLLQIPEFRNEFKNDITFAPFFMNGFYNDLGKYVEKNSDPKLKTELLEACTPKTLTSEQIDAELKKVLGFKEPLTPEQEDIIAIHKFLADTSVDSPIMRQLRLLEIELEKEAERNTKLKYDPKSKTFEGYVEGNPFKHNKFLSGFLKNWAKDHGFAGYGKLKVFMMPDEFYSFLTKGGIFKDPVLRGDFHGEFTHAIQWYLIIMWSNENPKAPILKCEPARLLQWLGEKSEEFNAVWSKTFESSTTSLYKPTDKDFRRVDNLHKSLNSKDCEFPVLHQLNLGKSIKKRSPKKDDKVEFEEFAEFKKKNKLRQILLIFIANDFSRCACKYIVMQRMLQEQST